MLGNAIIGGKHAKKIAPVVRSLIEAVHVSNDPQAPDHARIEITGSLATVLKPASGKRPT